MPFTAPSNLHLWCPVGLKSLLMPATLTLKCSSCLKTMILMVFYLAIVFSTKKSLFLPLKSIEAVCIALIHTQWLARVLQGVLLAGSLLGFKESLLLLTETSPLFLIAMVWNRRAASSLCLLSLCSRSLVGWTSPIDEKSEFQTPAFQKGS